MDKMRRAVCVVLAILVVSALLVSCGKSKSSEHQEMLATIMAQSSMFADGDLVFRRGVGTASHVVLFAEDRGMYSHVGILLNVGGKWMVIHSVPDEREYKGDIDRVKMDSLTKFFSLGRASNGAVMRVKADSIVRKRAALWAKHYADIRYPFDGDYDSSDTTKLYCTEFVEHVYSKFGVDISNGNTTEVNLPGMPQSVLMPDDLVRGGQLQVLLSF